METRDDPSPMRGVALMWLIALLMTPWFLITTSCLAQDDARTASTDWQKRTDLRDQGLRESEMFRQSLLRAKANGAFRRNGGRSD